MRRTPKRERRGRGEGGITYRADKRVWEASTPIAWTSNGQVRRRQVYAQTKGEALQKLRELQSQRDRGLSIEPNRLTVAQYFQFWLGQVARLSVRPSTLRDYTRYINTLIIPALGPIHVRRLTAIRIQCFLAELEERQKSPALRRKVYGVLSSALRLGRRLGIVTNDPCSGVTPPKVQRKEMLFLDVDQVAALLDVAATDRYYALFLLAVTVGLRQGELFGLRWADISLRAGTLAISRSVNEARVQRSDGRVVTRPAICETKTVGSRRMIMLPGIALGALRKHRRTMLAEGHLEHVFCDYEGGLLRKSNFLRRHWLPLVERFLRALPRGQADSLRCLRFHDLRHTAAALRLSLGDNIKVAQELLGHSSIRTTGDLYGHLAHSAREESVLRLDTAIRRAKSGVQRRAK